MNNKELIAQADRILEQLKEHKTLQEDTKSGLIKSVEKYKQELIERNNNYGSRKTGTKGTN